VPRILYYIIIFATSQLHFIISIVASKGPYNVFVEHSREESLLLRHWRLLLDGLVVIEQTTVPIPVPSQDVKPFIH